MLYIGCVVTIDANFYTSSAEAQIHIIGHVENREKAKVIIMTRLSIWLNSQRSDSNKDNNNNQNNNNNNNNNNTTTANTTNSTNNSDNVIINNSNTSLLAHPDGTLDYDLKIPNLPLPLSPTTGTSDNNSNNSNSSDSHDQPQQHDREREETGQGGAETRKPYIPKQFSTQFADQFSVLPPHLQINKSGTLTVDEYMARLRYDIDHNHTNHTFSTDTGTQHVATGGAGGNEVEEGGELVGISRTSSGKCVCVVYIYLLNVLYHVCIKYYILSSINIHSTHMRIS